MSLQQTKAQKKDESLVKQSTVEAARNNAAAQKQTQKQEGNKIQAQEPDASQNIIDQNNQGFEDAQQDLNGESKEEYKEQEISEEQKESEENLRIVEQLQQQDQANDGIANQVQRKPLTLIYEQGNITSSIDQDIIFDQQTLRYGDIITITFDKKITIENKGVEIFNGILYSNGVTKLNLDIISKKFKDNKDGFCNFKCTLFRIESCSSHEINQQMEILKQRRIQVEQEDDLGTKRPDNVKEIGKYIENQKKKIKELDKAILVLQKQLDKENKDNIYLNNHIRGSKVLYGDLILLKHLESDMYLSLNLKEAAEENGCVACKLMPLNEFSLISFVPQDQLRQNGQIIYYSDSFCIQSYHEPQANKQAKYLHTSEYKIDKESDKSQVFKAALEVNGSSDTSSYRARLFQPYDEKKDDSQDENIFSGDVVKLFHKQSGGYLTVILPDNSNEQKYNNRILKEQQEFQEAEKQLSTIIKTHFSNQSKEADKNLKDEMKKQNQDNKNEKEQLPLVPELIIENDPNDTDKAKYLWEIQKLKPFVIKQVNTQDAYRIKHVQTGLYLCITRPEKESEENSDKKTKQNAQRQDQSLSSPTKKESKDKKSKKDPNGKDDEKSFKLSLAELKDHHDFIFNVLKDLNVDEKDAKKKFDPIKDLNMIFLKQLMDKIYVQADQKQIDQDIQDTHIKRSIFKTQDQVQRQNQIHVICKPEAKDNQSKMIFTIQKAKRSQATLVRAASNIYNSVLYFFKKLNSFAEKPILEQKVEISDNALDVSQQENKMNESVEINNSFQFSNVEPINKIESASNEQLTSTTFDYFIAKRKENRLRKRTQHFINNIINLKQTLRQLQENKPDDYKLYQNYLDDSGVIDVLIKLLDLVNIKTTPKHRRFIYSKFKRNFEDYRNNKSAFLDHRKELEQYLEYIEDTAEDNDNMKLSIPMGSNNLLNKPSRIQKQKKDGKDYAYYITEQIVKTIPSEILSVILLMISGNQKVDSKLDNYPTILFQQLLGQNVKKAKKIFEMSYQLSRITSEKGDFESCKEANEKQMTNQSNLMRWIYLVFDPFYIDEQNQNLKQQVIYFKVISLICQDQEGKGIYENQQIAYEKVLEKDKRTRKIFFGMQDFQGKIQPYIQFQLRTKLKQGDDQSKIEADLKNDQEIFFKNNPSLQFLIDQQDKNSNDYKKLRRTPPIKLLPIFDLESQNSHNYWPYAQYLCAYLDFLISCVRNGQKNVQTYPQKIGLDALFIFNLIDQTKSYKLKVILIKLLTFLYINNDSIYGDYAISNRCYYLSNIEPFVMHHKKLQYKHYVDSSEDSRHEDKLIARKSEAEIEELKQLKIDFVKQKKKVYKILPMMIEKILLVDLDWREEENCQYFEEKVIQQKEIEQKPKQRLSLIIAALESSLELIQCEKYAPNLVLKIVYASAIVFSWFRYRKNKDQSSQKTELVSEDDQKDNLFSKFRLFKFIEKSRDNSQCKVLLNQVYRLLLQNLLYICKQRTNRQIMIALKSFKSQMDMNPLEQAIRSKIQKSIQKEMQDQQKGKQQISVSFASVLLQLFRFEADGKPVLSQNFIKQIQDETMKENCLQLNQFFLEKDGKVLKYNLQEYLLFLIFDKKLETDIKNKAFEVLMENFESIKYFKEEISKIFLITTDIEKWYRKMQYQRYKILLSAQDIIDISFRFAHKGLIKQIESIMSELNYQDPLFNTKQKMLNFLEFPTLFIDYIMKNIKYHDGFHNELFKIIMEFLYIYSFQNTENSKGLILQLDFLSSLKDQQNEKCITQIVKQLKQQERETQLIDHIIKQIHTLSQNYQANNLKDYNSKNFWHQETQMTREARIISSLLKCLNILAQDSIFNKGNIFNKLLKLSKFYEFLFFSRVMPKPKLESNVILPHPQEITEVELIIQCAKDYKKFILESQEQKVDYLKINYNSNRRFDRATANIKSIAFPRFRYMIHRRVLSLLIQSSQDSENAIPQIAKILSLKQLVAALKQIETPYLFKKKYLRLLFTIHLTQFDEQSNQSYFQEGKTQRKIFQDIIYEDLLEYPFAILMSLQSKQNQIIIENEKRQAQLAIASYLIENKNKILDQEPAYKELIKQPYVSTYIKDYKELRYISNDIIQIAVEDKMQQLFKLSQGSNLTTLQYQLLKQLQQYQVKLSKSDDPNSEKLDFSQDMSIQYQPQSISMRKLVGEDDSTPTPEQLASIIAPDQKKQDIPEVEIIKKLIIQTQESVNKNRDIIKTLRQSKNNSSIENIQQKTGKKDLYKEIFEDKIYFPRDFKYLDPNDQGEYWQYLYSLSKSMNMRDGLLIFIKDFFIRMKWDVSAEDIDKFRDRVLAPLIDMRRDFQTVSQTNLNIIPNGDELMLQIEEAIDAIQDAFLRQEERLRGVAINPGEKVEPQAEYLKTSINYTPETPLLITKSFKKEEAQAAHMVKKNNKGFEHSKNLGRALGEKVVRYALDRTIEEQDATMYQNQGDMVGISQGGMRVSYAPLHRSSVSLVPNQESEKLQKMYTKKINDMKLKKMLQYQKEEKDEIFKEFFLKINSYLIQKNHGLGEVFGIAKTYDNTQTIKQDDFLKKVKEITSSSGIGDKAFKFYSHIAQTQNKKKKEEKQENQNDLSSKDINLASFGEILIENIDEQILRKRHILIDLIRKKYQPVSSQHNTLKKKFKAFIKKVQGEIDIEYKETEMDKIIAIIIKTFKGQQMQEDMAIFFDNMISGLEEQNQRYYILLLLKGILDHYQATAKNVNDKSLEVMKEDIRKFYTVIHIMKQSGLAERLINYLNKKEKEEVQLISIQILNLLLEGMNRKMQEQIYDYIKEKQTVLEMAEYLKTQIENLTPTVIRQKFNYIKESSIVHIQQVQQRQDESKAYKGPKNKQSQSNYILQDIDLKDEEGIKTLITLQKERVETIKKFRSILRFIQLLCDNCHPGFQNYFRNQLTIQESRTSSSLYQSQIVQQRIESTSSFNIVVIVSKSFMKITDSLKDLIFYDTTTDVLIDQKNDNQMSLATLIQSFFDVIIDFLYGPCEENQILLSGWQKFLATLNFYLRSKNLYFFAQNQTHEQKFSLMFKGTLLLLAMIENSNDSKSREILKSLIQGISFPNLQKIMIDIHRQKILAFNGSEEIFKNRRKLSEYDQKNVLETKIYPKNSLRPSDEMIFEIGFNIFKLLYICKRLNDQLLPEFKTEHLNPQMLKQVEQLRNQMIEKEKNSLVQRLYKEKVLESDLTLEFLKRQIIWLHYQNDDKLARDPQKLINVYNFLQTRNAQIRSLETDAQKAKTKDQLDKLIIKGPSQNKNLSQHLNIKISNKIQDKQQTLWNSQKYNSSGFVSKIEQFGQENFLQNPNSVDVNKSLLMLDKIEENSHHAIKNLVTNFEKLNEEKWKKEVNKVLNEFDEFQDGMAGSDGNLIHISQALEYFQLEKALQFYKEYVAEVEVDYDGTLVRSIFKIPTKCAFLSAKSRENILYGQQNNSLFDKLEGLFSQMNVLIAEMKSNQRLSRKSKLRYCISISNPAFQTLATVFIVLINLVYLIFYTYDRDSGTTYFTQEHMDIVVWVLAIAQAFIAFIIHLGYIEKYHGAYYQKYIESQKEIISEQFTKFKGSLGFAEGIKTKHSQRAIVETEMHNLRERYNRSKRQKKKAATLLNNIWYCVKIYFIGLNLDPIHAFNLLFFACSIGAIYQPFLFSILLLENVLQIPLLFSVIKAIVENRKQILLTLLLLLVIVYVYSFIAFITFRDTYISIDSGDEASLNSYCERLGYCFTSTLNNGIRSGGGIGDTLEQLSINDDLYWARYAFDLTFYIMIIVLLLNLIFGIIIDAFAAMRDKRNEVEKEVQEKCFICGNPSSAFESQKKSFQDHIQREHNVYAYIYYIFYLSRKPMDECTGVERFVQNMIMKEDPNFFPILKSLSLNEQPLEEKALENQAENIN